MCECGCGEFQPFARFPGPKGVTYTVSKYTNVDCGCGNPAGVIVTRITAEVMKAWGMERSEISRLPQLEFRPPLHDFAIAVIGKDELGEVGQEQSIGVLQEALRLTEKRYPVI